MAARCKLVVCVPARDEADRLPRLLDALASQTVQAEIVVALNNTTDGSRDAIADARVRHPGLKLTVDETNFAPADAHAGSARRRAMDIAADLAGPDGVLLTTDADTRPPPDWFAENVKGISRGLDIVGGRIVIDELEPLSAEVDAAQSRADRYWARVREIEDSIDPVHWDLPPRHGDHTGASLCMTVAAYRRCGGVPAVRSGEDRALVRAVMGQGGRLAHPSGIWTRVSPRTIGRAAGGMADHMKRLQDHSRANLEVMIPSFSQWRTRATWRRGIRDRGGAALIVDLEAELPPMTNDMALNDHNLGPEP